MVKFSKQMQQALFRVNSKFEKNDAKNVFFWKTPRKNFKICLAIPEIRRFIAFKTFY